MESESQSGPMQKKVAAGPAVGHSGDLLAPGGEHQMS